MSENLLTWSSVKLFGRVMTDLFLKYDGRQPTFGANLFLQKQIQAAGGASFTGTIGAAGDTNIKDLSSTVGLSPGMALTGPNGVLDSNTYVSEITDGKTVKISVPALAATKAGSFQVSFAPAFARIYAFSFEGQIYTLPRPTIFLVHGSGLQVNGTGQGHPLAAGPVRDNFRTTTDQSGVIAREWEFAAPANPTESDIRSWEYEKGDFSLRLDPESGPLEQILLQMMTRGGGDRADRAGAGLEVRSGAGLSGAGVSGAGVSGAGVSGAGLSGAGLRR